MKDYRDQLYKNLKLEGLKVALGILEIAKKVTTSDLVSKKQAKISLQDIKQYNINQQQKIQKSIAQKTTTSSVEFTTIPVLDNFDNFLTQIKINIPETLWSSIVIKKVSLDVDKYAIDESPSTDTTQKTFEATSFVDNSIFNNSNLSKNGFVLANEKYTQDLATIFSGIDSSKFQDSLVVVNLKILLSINGIDKVASKEYQFINYLDSEDELLNEFGYGKMIGVITDVNTSEPIADAMVNISSQATSYYTDANGNYNISLLPPATYSIRVSKDGYADTAQECIVEVNQTTECSIGIIEQNISTPFVASGVIKKTGQTISYTDYDDGYYQKGVSHSYTRDDNKEIVTDHITGLEWQDDSEAKTVTKQWLTTANYYAENYDDTSGDTATTYCSNLTLGGYNDWRLPTVQELLFIVDNSKYNPSIDSHFQNITSNDYWSSTDTSYTYDALYVNFHSGNTGYFKGFGLHICCVRAGE